MMAQDDILLKPFHFLIPIANEGVAVETKGWLFLVAFISVQIGIANKRIVIGLLCSRLFMQGVFFHWYPPKKLKYGKPRSGESKLT